jgi:hypothetical protein
MSAPKVGQRVRVVLEGEVEASEGSVFAIGGGGWRQWVIVSNGTTPSDLVVSVEVLRPPVKVGDVIETAEQLDALPPGAIVLDRDGDAWQRRRGWGWCCTTGGDVPGDFAPFTVLYLPDGAA